MATERFYRFDATLLATVEVRATSLKAARVAARDLIENGVVTVERDSSQGPTRLWVAIEGELDFDESFKERK